MPKKYATPSFLSSTVTPEAYERWLHRKAAAHVRRDRRRNLVCSNAAYKAAIHAAVVSSGGFDAYTGEALNWSLISTYKNEDSKAGRYAYKAKLALLPTVDHTEPGASVASFKICSWRTNDAKNDLSVTEFISLCREVLTHAGFKVSNLG